VKRVEIEIGEIEKDEVKEKKKNRKQYLYAVAVLGVVGLLLGMATGIPIGAQVAVPALSSVAYFFDGGHELNVPQWVWYYFHDHEDAAHAFIHAVLNVGLGIILDYIGVNLVTGVDDILAAGTEAVATYLATLFAAYLPWWLTPVAVGYISAIAAL